MHYRWRFRPGQAGWLGAAAVLAGLAGAPALAAGPDLDGGAGLSMGPADRPDRAAGAAGNPAAVGVAGPRATLSALGIPTAQLELGPVGGLDADIDRLLEIATKDEIGPAEANDLVAEANAILDRLGDDAYAVVRGQGSVPATPADLRIPTRAGHIGLSVDVNGQAMGRASVLDDAFTANALPGGDFEIATNTAGYIKTGRIVTVSGSYAQPVLGRLVPGNLVAGGRANYYEARLAKAVLAFDPSSDDQPDYLQLAQDELDRNRKTTRTVGIDIGAIWQSSAGKKTTQIGLTVHDVNAPQLHYAALGENCGDLDDADAANNCRTARFFGDRIALDETITLGPRLRASAAVSGAQQPWRLAASLDGLPTEDGVADAYQWLTLGGSYAPSGGFMPGGRLGYRRNLAGSQLGYITGGLSLFSVWDIDIGTTLETVTLSGITLPRSFMASTSVSLSF